jgi:hypothetical protein
MSKPKDFNLDDVPARANRQSAGTRSEKAEGEAASSKDVNDAGKILAAELESKGYHPVIVFGNAASGKTSLILSLLAAIKSEPALDTGLFLGEPILDTSTPYGRYLRDHADQFFNKKTQDFMDGVASPKTNIDYPFLIPVTIRPRGRPEVKLAFLESNGEWYRPDRESDSVFPSLRKQIEDLIREYQLGMSFIHLVPYTQGGIRTMRDDTSADKSLLQEASLAIVGALNGYEKIRIDKSRDRHIMLVTKWDAHRPPQSTTLDVLLDSADDVQPFLEQHYTQALATYGGITIPSNSLFLANFCAGLMTDRNVLSLRVDSELRPAVLRYPLALWAWLHSNALRDRGEIASGLFSVTEDRAPKFIRRIWDVLDRLF